MSEMIDYVYKPLQPREIRLLRLAPVRHAGDGLSGSIFHYALQNPKFYFGKENSSCMVYAQRYEAISYHWGNDPRTPHQLIVDDVDGTQSIIRLTSSLNIVLRQLAYPDKERVLWADAICIDQVNSISNTEKGDQIRIMPDIYRLATRVLVSLGPWTDDLPLAIDFLHLISDYAEYLNDAHHPEGEVGLHRAQLNGFVLPKPDDPRWPAIRAFFCRPWFRRVWVIQEFAYAADIVVTCGEAVLDWRKLWLAAMAYANNRSLMFTGYEAEWWGRKRMDALREAHEGAKSLYTITDLRLRAWGYMSSAYMGLSMDRGMNIGGEEEPELTVRKNFESVKDFEDTMRKFSLEDHANGNVFPYGKPSFMSLLQMTANFHATHKVDRLYALLGLADDIHDVPVVYSEQETASVVSHKFALSLVEQGKGAYVLSASGLQSEKLMRGQPPTWVPDWVAVRFTQDQVVSLHKLSRVFADVDEKTTKDNEETPTSPPADGEHERPKPFYNASLDTPLKIVVHKETRIITVVATPVDIITTVLPGKLLYGVPMYEVMVKSIGPRYMTGEPIEEALWRTMTFNRTWSGERPGPDYAVQYEALKRYETAMFNRNVQWIAGGLLLLMPVLILGIRFVPIYAHVLLMILVKSYTELPLQHGFIILLFVLPLLRWLHILAMIPTLGVLVWYAVAKLYPLGTLKAMSKIGLSVGGLRSTMPNECLGILNSMALTGNKFNLCITRKHLLGLSPPRAKPGDIVAIIHGCDAPFVLRPTNRQGYYQVVGEGYVHGIMDGEAMGGDSLEICLI